MDDVSPAGRDFSLTGDADGVTLESELPVSGELGSLAPETGLPEPARMFSAAGSLSSYSVSSQIFFSLPNQLNANAPRLSTNG